MRPAVPTRGRLTFCKFHVLVNHLERALENPEIVSFFQNLLKNIKATLNADTIEKLVGLRLITMARGNAELTESGSFLAKAAEMLQT
jgi:hypothetical protein